MQAVTNFLAMGGYAAYVWPAYGAAVVLLGGLLWASLRALRRAEALLRSLEGREGSRRRAGGEPDEPNLQGTEPIHP